MKEPLYGIIVTRCILCTMFEMSATGLETTMPLSMTSDCCMAAHSAHSSNNYIEII